MPLYETLLDRTYFTGEYNIGQVDLLAVEDELKLFIRKYEYDFLVKLMGLPLYEAFYAGMKGTTPAQKWLDMAYGKFFLLDASLVKTGSRVDLLGRILCIPGEPYYDKMPVNYRGLLKRMDDTDDESILNSGYGAISPIAKFIYYYWMKSHASFSGGAGESIPDVHNAAVITNSQKMCRAWNEMCKEVITFYHFLDMNIADYGEFNLEPDGRFAPVPINTFNFLY